MSGASAIRTATGQFRAPGAVTAGSTFTATGSDGRVATSACRWSFGFRIVQKCGYVYFWDHEHEAEDEPTYDNMHLIAKSFTEFLDKPTARTDARQWRLGSRTACRL
jgi:hypothetical protein